MKAYIHWQDGKQWMRIIPDNGMEYDEPISGWVEILNLTNGKISYKKGSVEIDGI